MKQIVKTPQFLVTVLGTLMITISLVNRGSGTVQEVLVEPDLNNNIQLQVRPAKGAPQSTIDQLQGTQSLQPQTGNLQQPRGVNQLQPNANTDTFNNTRDVQ